MKINYSIKRTIKEGDIVIFNKELYDSLSAEEWLGHPRNPINYSNLDKIHHNQEFKVTKVGKTKVQSAFRIYEYYPFVNLENAEWSYPLKVVTKKI